jgi:hypothetical protein
VLHVGHRSIGVRDACAFYALLFIYYLLFIVLSFYPYFRNVIGNINLLWGRKRGGGATVHEDYGGVARGCAHGRRSEKDGGRNDERHEDRGVAVHGLADDPEGRSRERLARAFALEAHKTRSESCWTGVVRECSGRSGPLYFLLIGFSLMKK